MPMVAPTAMSVGQCTPVWTREYATAAASGARTAPAAGDSMHTAVVNAAAEAA